MPRGRKNKIREQRLTYEIVVDAYTAEEQAMGWYVYLDDKLSFPFSAKCILERALSPLRKGETVQVVGMAPEEECSREMFVTIAWEDRELAVPLAQLKPINPDVRTKEAVGDWHYWLEQGYQFMDSR